MGDVGERGRLSTTKAHRARWRQSVCCFTVEESVAALCDRQTRGGSRPEVDMMLIVKKVRQFLQRQRDIRAACVGLNCY